MNKKLIFLCKFALVTAIFYWLIQSGRLDIKGIVESLEASAFLLALLAIGIGFYFSAERLRYLLSIVSIQITLLDAVRFFLIGLFFNFIMPGGVGGDIMKGFFIYRHHEENKNKVPATLFFDRLLGLFTLFFIGSIAILYNHALVNESGILLRISQLCLMFTAIGSFVGGFLFYVDSHKLNLVIKKFIPFAKSRPIQAVLNCIYAMFSAPKILLTSFAFSLIAQACFILVLIIVGRSIGFTSVSVEGYFLIGALGFLLASVPLAPAGVGVGQAAFLFIANGYMGQVTTLGPSIITVFQVLSVLWGLIGGLLYLRSGSPSAKVAATKAASF